MDVNIGQSNKICPLQKKAAICDTVYVKSSRKNQVVQAVNSLVKYRRWLAKNTNREELYVDHVEVTISCPNDVFQSDSLHQLQMSIRHVTSLLIHKTHVTICTQHGVFAPTVCSKTYPSVHRPSRAHVA